MNRLFFILLSCFFSLSDFAQTPAIEHLKKSISVAKNSRQKLESILLLCEERQSLSTDTLFHYASWANELALANHDKRAISFARYDIAFCLARREVLDSSLQIIDEELLAYRNKDREMYVTFAMLKARVLDRSNKYAEALKQLFDVLNSAELHSDTLNQIMAKTGIGWIRLEMNQPAEALTWLHAAESIAINPEYYKNYGALFSNIASAYNDIGKNDSAEYYIKKAIDLSRQSGTLTFLATALNFQANIFIDTKRIERAEASLQEALEIRKQIGDPYYTIPDMAQLALFYARNNQPQKGIILCNDAIAMVHNHMLLSNLPVVYRALAENYKAMGDIDKYSSTLEKIISLKDSFYKTNASETLAKIQSQYDLQKRENVIMQQRFSLAKKNYIIIGSVLLLMIVVTAAYFIFRAYKTKQKIRTEMMLQEEKLLGIQAVKEAEENERKRIAADLHDNLGVYTASIASNIDIILSEQTANNSQVALSLLRANSQSIVAQLGDTIWALKKDALSLTAISDRLKAFIQRIQSSYPKVKIDVLEKITNDHLLPPSQAFHLFQILKEGINNALKHSHCLNIVVVVEGDSEWKITIADDGKGIADNKNINGNGLMNMRNRSRESGWKIEWLANQPRGTAVVVAPVKN